MLEITSVPGGAKVFIDGKRKGSTPTQPGKALVLELEDGEYQLEAVIEGPPERRIGEKVYMGGGIQPLHLEVERRAREEEERKARAEREAAERRAQAEREERAKREAAERRAQEATFEKEWQARLAAAPSRLQAAPTVGRGEGPDMVPIPEGCFQMGSPASEKYRASYEGPQHRVCVKAFKLGQYEVTFAEWDACVAAGGCQYKPEDRGWGRGRRPVIEVSWDDAQGYVKWLNGKTGKRYRLPSEAEWEYAARAGTTTPFSTGACIHTDQANYDGNYDYNNCGAKTGVYLQKTQPVGSYPANPWGLYDVHGNLWEWAEDCWNDNYQGAPTDGSAWRHGNCSQRVLRGGSWVSVPGGLRCADRIRGGAGLRDYGVGFRLARTLTP